MAINVELSFSLCLLCAKNEKAKKDILSIHMHVTPDIPKVQHTIRNRHKDNRLIDMAL